MKRPRAKTISMSRLEEATVHLACFLDGSYVRADENRRVKLAAEIEKIRTIDHFCPILGPAIDNSWPFS